MTKPRRNLLQEKLACLVEKEDVRDTEPGLLLEDLAALGCPNHAVGRVDQIDQHVLTLYRQGVPPRA